MKMRYRSHRYDIYRPRSWHEHKYSEYQKCLNMMMLKCIKQHLSKILSSAHEKVKQYWAELKESIAYKKACIRVQKPTLVVATNEMSAHT